MSDYTPSWMGDATVDTPTPPERQWALGPREDDHDPAPSPDADTTETDTEPETEPETPAWVDDSRAVRDPDLRDPSDIDTMCRDCLTDAARASYQCVAPAHTSAWYQLLDRHGFGRAVGEDERVWGADGGLVVRAHGQSVDPDDDTHLSYLVISGSAADVSAFVEDLIDVTASVKRELRAPSLVEDADAAQVAGDRVPEDARLVNSDRAAETVRRLPRGEAE